jgi:hypothetical protein
MFRWGGVDVAKQKKVAKEGAELRVRVVVEPGEGTPVFYINYAEVGHTANDFALLGARVPAKPTRDQIEQAKSSGVLPVEADVLLVIPPTVIPGLIRALSGQQAKYEEEVGSPIIDTGARDE